MAIKAESKPGALAAFSGFFAELREHPVARFAIGTAAVGVIAAIALVAVMFSPWIRGLPVDGQATLFQLMMAVWPASVLFMSPDSWSDLGQLFWLVSAAIVLNGLLYGAIGFAARLFWLRFQRARGRQDSGAPPGR